mmetsp:Transcript_33888/g.76155  ORF Transcript_33888/g.76155 Transcript_33888/m.76155 type:complete len:104 (-) Transcript_33888:4080-4391(-)
MPVNFESLSPDPTMWDIQSYAKVQENIFVEPSPVTILSSSGTSWSQKCQTMIFPMNQFLLLILTIKTLLNGYLLRLTVLGLDRLPWNNCLTMFFSMTLHQILT